MKIANRDVCDIHVFDEDGKQVAALNSLKEARFINSDSPSMLYVRDVMLDPDMLKFLAKPESDHLSDYDKFLKKGTEYKTYVFNKSKKKCKVVAFTYYRDEDGFDRKAYYEFPNALVSTCIDYESNGEDLFPNDLVFEAFTFNDDGDTYKLHIEDRDNQFTNEKMQQEILALKKELEVMKAHNKAKQITLKPLEYTPLSKYIGLSEE